MQMAREARERAARRVIETESDPPCTEGEADTHGERLAEAAFIDWARRPQIALTWAYAIENHADERPDVRRVGQVQNEGGSVVRRRFATAQMEGYQIPDGYTVDRFVARSRRKALFVALVWPWLNGDEGTLEKSPVVVMPEL